MIVPLTIAVLAGQATAQQTNRDKSNPCRSLRLKAETSAWRTFVDSQHGFCFRYPPAYKPIAEASREQRGRRVAHGYGECSAPQLERKRPDATIRVCLLDWLFDDANLMRMRPTGNEAPPEPLVVGNYTFYYYGPGGGGVAYPDLYFFDLRGKILVIEFYGPYDGRSKSPTEETKAMERKLLATFRTF